MQALLLFSSTTILISGGGKVLPRYLCAFYTSLTHSKHISLAIYSLLSPTTSRLHSRIRFEYSQVFGASNISASGEVFLTAVPSSLRSRYQGKNFVWRDTCTTPNLSHACSLAISRQFSYQQSIGVSLARSRLPSFAQLVG